MSVVTELARLRAEGVGPRDRVLVSHSFSQLGATPEERQGFRDALLGFGFGDVDGDNEGGDDHYWGWWTLTAVEASEDACSRLDSFARTIANQHGAIYHSWRVDRNQNGERSPIEDVDRFR